VVALARALLGTDTIACWNAHYFCKEAVADATERIYHRDFTGWPFSPMRNVSIWLAPGAAAGTVLAAREC